MFEVLVLSRQAVKICNAFSVWYETPYSGIQYYKSYEYKMQLMLLYIWVFN